MQRLFSLTVGIVVALAILLSVSAPASAKDRGYTTGFVRWRGATGGFDAWQRAGVRLTATGALELDPATARADRDPSGPNGYHGRSFFNGSGFLVGEAFSPVTLSSFTFKEAIASWHADTPPGTWIETLLRVRIGANWSKWFNMGVWASDASTVERHSVTEQRDVDGYVDVDTLILTNSTPRANAFQLRLRLFSADGSTVPSLRGASITLSGSPAKPDGLVPGRPQRWNRILAVPECSQMVYRDGGDVWCSPTSTAMVLAYWGGDGTPCEARVRATVEGVYDWLDDGHGNWPFNTAYAATRGFEGYVARFASLAQAEKWIEAGVPVIVSMAWDRQELTGSALPASNGHLMVLVGFDPAGNPVVNDPAAESDDTVQRTYLRGEFESLWLGTRGGTAYLIYPPGWPIPSLGSLGWRLRRPFKPGHS